MDKYLVITLNGISFYAKHKILRDLALAIALNNHFAFNSKKINVFIGIHEWINDSLPFNQFNLGVQTEQYYDCDQKRLWGLWRLTLPYLLFSKFDYLLDFSASNKHAYRYIFSKKRLLFGPYIFPEFEVNYHAYPQKNLVFFGAINDRRQKIISILEKHLKIQRFEDISFDDVKEVINRSSGVVNIHYSDGIYAEWPRILYAYLCGKIIYSESLGDQLVEGKHYLSVYSNSPHTELDRFNIFSAFKKDIALKFKAQDAFVQASNLKKKSMFNFYIYYFFKAMYIFEASIQRINFLKI